MLEDLDLTTIPDANARSLIQRLLNLIEQLDRRIAKTQAKKAPLLQVLDHLELPLHNNAAELAVRQRVRKRDVSFGPRSEEAGKEAWDTFMTLAATTKKLGVSFYTYLRDYILATQLFHP